MKSGVGKTKKRRHVWIGILAFILVIGSIAYLLANRYLIEHVEYYVADTASSSAASESSAVQTEYTADDWNYKSDSKTISIKKVTTGTGSNAVTYYAADIQLTDVQSLCSAFAKNQFGRNIIAYTSQIAAEHNAVFAINGDYYGFRNDGLIIRNGTLYRDSPVRTGLAFYKDGTMQIYDETAVSSGELLRAGVWNTFSFGPALVKDGVAVTDFGSTRVDTNFGNQSIQDSNPRTGVGILSPNHFVFVVVDGRSAGYSKGMTLTEFAALFTDMGCTQAYNFDGGGSSTMYFMGRVVNNPLGKGQERGVSDILYVA